MALLLKDGDIVADAWTSPDDAAGADVEGPVIVSLDRWRRDRSAWVSRNSPVGVRLKSSQLAGEIAADLGHIALVALEFPKFRDGRAFSTARTLREQYGYAGEIRAFGQSLPDQYQFLLRTGFTTVELPDDARLAAWRHALAEIDVAYQAGVVEEAPLSLLRRKVALTAGVAKP
jgi:uncharacterized protein (DUF934 family)